MSHYEQDATDLDIWRAFRSRRRITIATDGSLLPLAGTFGWKITTSQHTVLFHGSGPIDGPIEIGRTTRSELGGFTGPLLLVTILARYWGLRHRCKFRWLVDSRIAINRVSFVTRKDHRPTRQPDNNDYLAVIHELHAELRRPIRAVWIKSHQDDSKDYGKLSADAKLNIDADALATAFHRRTRSNAMRSTAHLPCTKISISINKVRYYGNMDNNLQYHINGGYLRNYLQITHAGWTTKVWDNVDMEAFSRHLKKLTTPHKTTHLKFIHNLQPLGVNNFSRAKVQDPNLKRCPCCKDADENQHHLIGCKENPLRKDALATLLKTITSDDVHPFGITLAICIEKVAEDSEAHIAAPLEKQHQRFHAYIQDAINDQASIGWFHMLRGFMSTSWHVLAAINTANSKTLDHPRGHHKIQSVLKAFHKFTRDTMWLGRNEALHKEKDIADSQNILRRISRTPTLPLGPQAS